ncbi:MAG TPA: phenylalanine--tRNA ligase subunit alpha [Thermoanaerobaculia bacterium]|nr:phenylalanine--tRNA ligase subunit alpha [Thermoanaerobaculia bacterium]
MLEDLKAAFYRELDAANTTRELQELHSRWFGPKGKDKELFKELKALPPEQRAAFGQQINDFRNPAQTALNEKLGPVSAREERERENREVIDVTLPSRLPRLGHLHPITIVRRELEQIYREMGYTIDPGLEVESDWYNFEALNFTPDHPARDTQDTFFVDVDKLLLRTHTSNVQIRSMERWKPPVKVLSAGRVYRRDEITMRRSPMFHQAEGLLVDKGIHIGHLRATLEHTVRRLFGSEAQMRMRPSFFPFTEPSAEVDMSCIFCKGKGCGTCSQTGWMEILGCGMVHPQVLRNVGIDPEQWSGFAFGLGIDRVAMLKFDIPNIRTLFENDLRVLQQF